MIGSQTSNSPLIYPMINYESVKSFNLSTPSFFVIFKLANKASYSAWLFEALKLNPRAYLVTILLELVNMMLAPLL